MLKLTVNIPHNVPLAVIEAALAQLGASVVIAKPKPVKIEREYQPLIYTKADGTQDEIDGVTVEKTIRKMMLGIEAANRSDGRNKGHFANLPKDIGGYISRISQRWTLKPAQYLINGELITA